MLFNNSRSLIIATLYERYGKEAGTTLLDCFFDRLYEDPHFDWFFGKHRSSVMKKRFGDFLFGLIGKEPDFRRDEIISAHKPYFIDAGVYNRFIDHFRAALQEQKVDEKDAGLLMSVIESYREDVVS